MATRGTLNRGPELLSAMTELTGWRPNYRPNICDIAGDLGRGLDGLKALDEIDIDEDVVEDVYWDCSGRCSSYMARFVR